MERVGMVLEVNEFQLRWSIEELIEAMVTGRKGFRSFHKNKDNQIVATAEIVCFANIQGSKGFPVSVSLIVVEQHVKLRIDSGTIFSGGLTEIMKQSEDTLPAYIQGIVVRVLAGEDVSNIPF